MLRTCWSKPKLVRISGKWFLDNLPKTLFGTALRHVIPAPLVWGPSTHKRRRWRRELICKRGLYLFSFDHSALYVRIVLTWSLDVCSSKILWRFYYQAIRDSRGDATFQCKGKWSKAKEWHNWKRRKPQKSHSPSNLYHQSYTILAPLGLHHFDWTHLPIYPVSNAKNGGNVRLKGGTKKCANIWLTLRLWLMNTGMVTNPTIAHRMNTAMLVFLIVRYSNEATWRKKQKSR